MIGIPFVGMLLFDYSLYACVGRNAIVVKKRYGLCRLSLETGAQLLPCYVFGGSDFFENLLTSDSWLSNFARKSRMGITIFWGQFGLPIPYTPKVSLCMAEPIKVKKWTGEGKIPQELIDELHAKVNYFTAPHYCI